ncbi:MAG: putative transport system permease protein [Solirubrobacteraceae bacterium]|nr:putative transport system permease protein [Solirubrobacteraceae bacterium]
MRSYVWRDLARNPRRTLAALSGITLGVALFASVLFFVDGSGATMTQRAIAPLALDMQRVLDAPLGGGLALEERLAPAGGLRRGRVARVTLTVRNPGPVAANEVVVNDEPPPPLAYEHGTTRVGGRLLHDPAGQSPLAQGLARTGLNIGTVAPGSTVRLTYRARATAPVADTARLPPAGTISSRENVVPVQAGAPAATTAAALRARIARIPAVAAADTLSFADLPAGSLRVAGGAVVRNPVRVFAFDRRYAAHYPSIRIVAGGWRVGTSMLSAEAARRLGAGPGDTVSLRLPTVRRPLALRVGGVTDLARAKPLFYSRKTSRLEDFIYVPDSIVVSPELFRQAVVPAFRAASARLGSQLKSLPVTEVDVLVDRSRLRSDPGHALDQTRAVARAVAAVAPGQDELIDNISNTLGVARADAAVGRRMFVFLGLPAVLLAAFLTAYTGSILAIAARREQAILRIRGAHRGHLLRMLAYRTLALAGAGSVAGAGLGLLSAMAVLGPDTLFEASAASLLGSAGVAVTLGMLVTGLALWIPGARALRREISDERRELALAPRGRGALRAVRDLAVVAGAAVIGVVALRAARVEPAGGSVSEGRAVSAMPSQLLLAPLMLWSAGAFVASRTVRGIAARLPLPAPPRFGPLLSGTLRRSLRRRARPLGTGIAGVALVVAFGTALALFSDTYAGAKAADAAFVVGSDLRVTPSVLDPRPPPPSYARTLEVAGVAAMTPVVSKLDNAVLIGPYDQDRATLTAIEPAGFERVAALSDRFFAGGSAAAAMRALRADPRALLVNAETADALSIEPGMRVKVLLARGTKRQRLESFRVAGLFERFPGFPQGTSLVANLGFVAAATRSTGADFFLGAASEGGGAGLAHAVTALRSGPGRSRPLNVDTTATALDKDQSSLTALNVNGLVDIDTVYTLLMSAAVIAIFVFGLMLERRREYVVLRAQGMRGGELRALVLGEAAVVAAAGVAAGLAVGVGVAALLVRVLRPLFVLDPALTLPAGDIVLQAALAGAATLVSAAAATALLRRLKPAELLREA